MRRQNRSRHSDNANGTDRRDGSSGHNTGRHNQNGGHSRHSGQSGNASGSSRPFGSSGHNTGGHNQNGGHSRHSGQSGNASGSSRPFGRNNARGRSNNPSNMPNNESSRFNNPSNDNGRKKYGNVGFKYLESLLEKPVEEVMTKLSTNDGFFQLVDKNLNDMTPDMLILIVKIMAKFCDCEFSALRIRILQKSFSTSFIQTVQLYITKLPLIKHAERRKNSYFWRDPDAFWYDFLKICKVLLKEVPRLYAEVLVDLLGVIDLNLSHIEEKHSIHINDGIKQDFKDLIRVADSLVLEMSKAHVNNKIRPEVEGEPPEDFHEISVYPTAAELIENMKPFLRKNVIYGPYRDVDHYLDIQFRLLREDFVGPLRQGIHSYLSKTDKRLENVRIHKKVHFVQPETSTDDYCVLLKFHFGKNNMSFKYENSKRFMFGSLVCFTRDKFKSIIFGRIVDRKDELLKKGELIIGFDANEAVIFNHDYMMVECSVYFEPYYHVLNVMKRITDEDFPMKRYIIDVDTTAVLPSYLTPLTLYYVEGAYSWNPYIREYKTFNFFNASQNEAFIAALTREFSIIQGPPGTGKTYVGLKIARTLLMNYKYWSNRTPMLVVCYTNHALDQFLEGLLETTSEIIRIGGRSQNEKLKELNLRCRSRKMSHATYQDKLAVTECLSRIKRITETLKCIRGYDSVINPICMRHVIPHFSRSWLKNASDEDFIDWLVADRANPQEEFMAEEFKNLRIDNDAENVSGEPSDEESSDEDLLERVDEIDDLLVGIDLSQIKPIVSLPKLKEQLQQFLMRMEHFESEIEKGNQDIILAYMNLRTDCAYLHEMSQIIKTNMDLARRGAFEHPPTVDAINSQYISRTDRWHLYFYWISLFRDSLMEDYERENIRFRDVYRIYNQSRDMENIAILREAKVIGMTTTGASRLHSTLATLKSPIVIVEEAAEVLEAHIVTSLTKHCKQLILIGDHQQLKPSTSNYQIEKFYNLGISLFERMILNKVQCFTLNVQHRMRPEISSLIKPSIYPDLVDHESVKERPNIKGVSKCLYFIEHKHMEQSEADGTSKKNIHEVKFLIQLARYLILNGYESDQITILAAYLGQMFEFQKERKKYGTILKDIKIAVLDNYQGEECDIILLSLVRSNPDNKIGFLSIENRVCVALSRARNGMYVMGNMTMLCDNSELWVKIRQTLRSQDSIGTSLSLRCTNHNKITLVSEADDFASVSEGGCDRICGVLLNCHHTCPSMCHIQDMEHTLTRCQEKCLRPLCDTNPLHVCRKMCSEECGPCIYKVTRDLACGHRVSIPCWVDVTTYNCEINVTTELPCGHNAEKPCYVDPFKHKCPIPCDTRLECGHSCIRNCHVRDDPDHLVYKCIKPCEKYRSGCTNQDKNEHKCPKLCSEQCVACKIVVKKGRTICPHFYDVPCDMNPDEIECKKPCKKTLPCGHKCPSMCFQPCGPCEEKVLKTIPGCNHERKLPCIMEPERKHCNGNCPRIMTCGHKCEGHCNEECDPMKCKKIVEVSIPGGCGHILKRLPCHMKTTYGQKGEEVAKGYESFCREPCKTLLKCGKDSAHSCKGSCGECFQGRIHKRCSEKCGQILVCNHECEVFCRETCKPCQKKCSYKCKHSICKKRCGEPCSQCVEQCTRRCKHQGCSKKCGEICDVPPCDKPCDKVLKCGHDCVGFCGDTCPPLCRICNKDELEEILFGNEDDEDARFVLLKDCNHVIESEGMEQWLQQDADKIMFKLCPKCKTTITTTERYSDYVKRAVEDVMKVKTQQHGTPAAIHQKKEELKTALEVVRKEAEIMAAYHSELAYVFSVYVDSLKVRLMENKKGRAQPVNLVELNSIEIKYQLLHEICNILKKLPKILNSSFSTSVRKQVNFILTNLFRTIDDVTTNEIEDIQREINRLNRMINFGLIIHSQQASYHRNKPEAVLKIQEISDLLNLIFAYTESVDENVKKRLIELEKIFASSIGITEQEKREIVRAVGLAKGHWFKCPNGHPYAIGDCGGAMQQSYCYECKVPIGGSNHRLLSTNEVATEMDGATHGAWSEAVNMANYQFL